MKKLFLSLFALAVFFAGAAAQQKMIPASDQKICIEGARHISFTSDGKAVIDRISPALFGPEDFRIDPFTAITQTGVRVIIKTDSRTLEPVITEKDGKKRPQTWFYGIYCDGKFMGDVPGTDPVITSSSEGMHEWRIVLPIMYSADFDGVKVDENATLAKVKSSKKPVYFAIGDSISHGTGQSDHGSEISYPFAVAEANGYYLYNLAVGGSKITPDIAEELKGVKADIITILWGYNDWNNTQGDLEEIARRYDALLYRLEKVQPKARIYCIMPTTAKNEEGREGYHGTLSQVRDAEREVVLKHQATKAGRNIRIIEGSSISSESDLVDAVHFSNDGAARFAAALSPLVK